MLKRLTKTICFLPALFIVLPMELIYYWMRWIIIGKSFPQYPMVHKLIIW